MTRYALMVCALLLTGCGREKPVVAPDAVTPIAEQDREIAKRLEEQKVAADAKFREEQDAAARKETVTAMRAVADRWNAEYPNIFGKTPAELAAVLTKLQAIRGEMQGAPTTQCSEKARNTFTSGMDTVVNAVTAFINSQGEPPPDTQEKFGAGAEIMRRAQAELSPCQLSNTASK